MKRDMEAYISWEQWRQGCPPRPGPRRRKAGPWGAASVERRHLWLLGLIWSFWRCSKKGPGHGILLSAERPRLCHWTSLSSHYFSPEPRDVAERDTALGWRDPIQVQVWASDSTHPCLFLHLWDRKNKHGLLGETKDQLIVEFLELFKS